MPPQLPPQALHERWIKKLKTKPFVAVILAMTAFIIGLGQGAGAIKTILEVLQQIVPTSNTERLDKEIAFRLRSVPDTLKRSRAASNPVAKANLLNGVFELAEQNRESSLFPEFSKRSVLSLCDDLVAQSSLTSRNSTLTTYHLLQGWAKDAQEKYLVFNMYKMSPPELERAQSAAEKLYEAVIQSHPAWHVP
ncbi:MAG: hypothetical protein IT389_12790 [Nitrospira sp.]|nr:hypothetical protein [Nitrospira sp.]